MPFANAVNSSNNDFELSSGVLQFANRVRLQTIFGVENIGMVQASGTTFTVQGGNAALGSTNPGYVTLQSKATPGTLVKYTVTANQSCTATDLGATSFGITNGIAYANDFPLYVYAVGNAAAGASPETILKFFLSRYPNTKVSPAAGSIGKAGSIVANTQGGFFALDSSITVADYAASPCMCIGSLRAQRSSGNAITFTTMDAGDGIGQFQEARSFSIPINQFGAAASSYFYANGGTAPQFSDIGIGYYVDRMNQVQLSAKFANCTVAGVGAVNLQLALPYSIDGDAVGSGKVTNNTGAFLVGCTSVQAAGPNNKLIMTIVNDASNLVLLNNNVVIAAGYVVSYFMRSMIIFA